MNNKPDVKYILEDTNGNKYTILDTQRVELQEELNKEIEKQAIEIKRLKEEYMILQNASDEVEEEKDREIERLNNIINKAIKWFENADRRGLNELLDILKGSGKE